MHKKLILMALPLVAAIGWAWAADSQPAGQGSSPTSTPAAGVQARPAKKSNLDYWLSQAKPVGEANATADANSTVARKPTSSPGTNPFDTDQNFTREDAVPGVMELSDGELIAGYIYTTRDHLLQIWIDPNNKINEGLDQWHYQRVGLPAISKIETIIIEEAMDQEWRWKEMGQPERVFTGRSAPTRRHAWKVHLMDDSTVVGDIDGQPIWIENAEKKYGPYLFSRTTKGSYDQTLAELIYIKQIIVSRRLMQEVQEYQKKNPPASRPAASRSATSKPTSKPATK